MKLLKKTTLLSLVFIFLFGSIFSPVIAAEDYSHIRVRLTMSPSEPKTVNISLNNSYTVHEKSSLTLPKGSYTLTAENGKVRIKGGSVNELISSVATLKPKAATNLMTVQKTVHGTRSYRGDMKFTYINIKNEDDEIDVFNKDCVFGSVSMTGYLFSC